MGLLLMKACRIVFLEVKNNFKLFALFSLLLSIIGAISICFFSFSFNINNEMNDYLFRDLKTIDIKICSLSKEDSMVFKDFYYEINDEFLSNSIKEENDFLDGLNIMYCNSLSKSNIKVDNGLKKDLNINEIIVKGKFDYPSKIKVLLNKEVIDLEIVGSFDGIDADIIFAKLFYEKYTKNGESNIRLLFEKDDADIIYKAIKKNNLSIIDYFGLIALYDYLHISKTIFTFTSIFFMLLFSIILITFFDIILYRRKDYFSLLQAIGYKKSQIFLDYFLILVFSLLMTTILMIPLSFAINNLICKILLTNFDNIKIGLNINSVFIVVLFNLFFVAILLFLNIRKKLKTITIGEEIQ